MTPIAAHRSRHLDLGCGTRPRNPYQREELHGIDIQDAISTPDIEVRRANLALEPIPYPDNYFDSVSAYDFLEHVPRILPKEGGTRFPFIELMNEIWRVLTPQGRFYASTPAYPHSVAFQDPTHVNILTCASHEYFTHPQLMARMCGYSGDLTLIRMQPVLGGQLEYQPLPATGYWERRRLRRRERRGENTYIIREFEAQKA